MVIPLFSPFVKPNQHNGLQNKIPRTKLYLTMRFDLRFDQNCAHKYYIKAVFCFVLGLQISSGDKGTRIWSGIVFYVMLSFYFFNPSIPDGQIYKISIIASLSALFSSDSLFSLLFFKIENVEERGNAKMPISAIGPSLDILETPGWPAWRPEHARDHGFSSYEL